MNSSIYSDALGLFSYNETTKNFENYKGNIHFILNSINIGGAKELLIGVEKQFSTVEVFEQHVKTSVAENLLDYKNDFWPEYDENDPNLNWEAVDAGEYNITLKEFVSSISLSDVVINKHAIYCEFYDGDLFGGHRIHATFSRDLKLLKANI
ncbi:DUF2262 domain-containing protein [Psychrobacillus sp. FSL K6-4046]|uniref:DUF2262 domain-containing protein n=1 Tax=Psychrobacillus sp. FSL K6-4046 TaxID=2921550 RepID=UPI00315AEC35